MSTLPLDPFDSSVTEPGLAGRILGSARHHLFTRFNSTFTMDDLAGELGVSKKTLYLHFPGKDAIIGAIIDGLGAFVHARLELIANNPNLNCIEKLCAAIQLIGRALSRVTPALMRDLKRNAPDLYQKVDDMRRKNIPVFFSKLIRSGIKEGTIRSDIDPDFAAEFWFQAIRGLMDPETMDRTQLSPKQCLEQAVQLYFKGLLTSNGHSQFSQHMDTCQKHSAL